jgi:hypothetical protein
LHKCLDTGTKRINTRNCVIFTKLENGLKCPYYICYVKYVNTPDPQTEKLYWKKKQLGCEAMKSWEITLSQLQPGVRWQAWNNETELWDTTLLQCDMDKWSVRTMEGGKEIQPCPDQWESELPLWETALWYPEDETRIHQTARNLSIKRLMAVHKVNTWPYVLP